MKSIKERLGDACVGQPAKIPWPHRLLHDAIAEITRLEQRCAELESETSRDKQEVYVAGAALRTILKKNEDA